ncbi:MULTISPECIES: hypothetical protein [unclassified Haloarcula]|uniref:hypothetical protein n=1 Tax=unclassified Haloarcula TaxID=2624677 RepID=UPI000EF23BA4|nr:MULTISPECIES: hypothetical protein [unclassified Haloarcula]RLM34099.1 hypothetical protein DVK01_16655 [Haloarcula sp. Atlit-120R]RLM42326.1 hypothetical protein DVK00_14710 [Haloarcula sp. Atlit-47R]
MADDSGLTSFINSSESSSGYQIVDTANPVNWTRVGASILLSTVATVYIGLRRYIDELIGIPERLIEGATSFVGEVSTGETPTGSGVLGELFVPILQWYQQDLWASSVEQFGLWGYLVAVGFTLVTLFVVVRGLREGAQRLAGGE